MMRCERGNSHATPGCDCGYCTAVFDEWAEQAMGFQRWYDGLSPEAARRFFGEIREVKE